MKMKFPLILDGATGTELAKAGLTNDTASELWMLEHEDAVLELQSGYAEAGSQVLYTPTFGSSPVSLAKHGLKERTAELNMRLFELTKKASAGRTLIGGDIGPGGLMPRPFGHLGFEELAESFAEQAKALDEAGVDLFAVETQMSIAEARAAFLGIRKVSDKPVFVSFTCGKDGKTLDGSDMRAALVTLQAMGAAAFGLNCSWGPEEMLPVIQSLAPYAAVPLIAKPNAGLPQFVDGQAVYDCTPEEFTAYTADFLAAGAVILGGCCGTDKTHMKALAEKVRQCGDAFALPEGDGQVYCSCEKYALAVTEDMTFIPAFSCGEDFEEVLDDAAEEEGDALRIVIDGSTDFDAFENCQYMIAKPVCFESSDAAALEKALRLYRGRAMYEGGLPEEALAPLKEKYGLIDLAGL